MPLTRPVHPYLEVWIACRRYAGPFGGIALPEAGAWLDQDAELMMALDILSDLYAAIEDENKRREEGKQKAAELNAPAAN